MATKKTSSAKSGTSQPTVAEIKQWYMENKTLIEKFAQQNITPYTLRDIAKRANTKRISTIDKQKLKRYMQDISANEKQLRDVARYLYYRSNVFFRIVNWYADMWDLRCRIITPQYSLTKNNNANKTKKSFEDTINILEAMNMQGNMVSRLINVYIQDVSYALTYLDDTGLFFYELNPDECAIETIYNTGDYGFAIDMSKWDSDYRQQIIEFLGSPLKEMYAEYKNSNGQKKWIHCPDEYASVFKFRTDLLDVNVPPLLPNFLGLANLEDLVDIQADADALSIYKLIYMPLKTISGSKSVDDFEINPATAKPYFDKLVNTEVIPENVSAAMVPGDELKVIDFSGSADTDTTSVEKASNQILQTAGGGAVLNSNKITSTAAFNAWLKAETEFAISTLMPQVNGFVNRILQLKLSTPCKVDHFEISVYTKEAKAEELLKSCQYSFANRLAYNTCIGISEKATLAMLYFENEVLDLPNIMKYPLSSSFTTSSNSEGGAPTKGDNEDTAESTERMRNQ